MLLAGLRGIEAHGRRDLRPGQPLAARGEQQSDLGSVQLRASGRHQGQRALEVVGGQFGRPPHGTTKQIGRRGRGRPVLPGPGLESVGTEIQEVLAGTLLTVGHRSVPGGLTGKIRLRNMGVVGHPFRLQNQQNVVNILLMEVVVFLALRDASIETSGPKAAVLGALLRADFPIPGGFVIPPAVAPPWDASVRERLSARLELLGGAVAVRSSALGEDGATASGAGQYVSVLDMWGPDAVLAAVDRCRRSMDGPLASAYRSKTRQQKPAGMAVVVQRMVDARVSGVMFTADEQRAGAVIEAGVGRAGVVDGHATPRRYRVSVDGTVTFEHSGAAGKRPTPTAGNRHRHPLADRDIRDLAAIGVRVADQLGGPRDIEWAWDGAGFHILQARPVTVPLPVPASTGGETDSATTLLGCPAAAGTAAGPARIVRGPADFSTVNAGDILVCPFTDPSWTPLLRIAAAVITDVGGILSHAAIVAREYGLPAVLGVPEATSVLRSGEQVVVDGNTGTVHRGGPSSPPTSTSTSTGR